MEIYARELIPRLAAVEGLRLTAFINREAAEADRGPWREIAHESVPVRARNRFEWVRGEQQYLPRLAGRAGCDVVHSLASTAPLRGQFVRVTTIHDLNYKLVPDAHFGLLRLGMGLLVPAAAWRSHRIVVDARATARRCARAPSRAEREDRRGPARRRPSGRGGAHPRVGVARVARSRRPADRAQRLGEAPAQESAAAPRGARAAQR